jgi:hydroxymethylpyrimidine/phosphomethylpyrimidine kinase
LSAAIAAYIVLGRDLGGAVGEAKAFVGAAIRRGGRLHLGAGPGPLVPAPLRRR